MIRTARIISGIEPFGALAARQQFPPYGGYPLAQASPREVTAITAERSIN